jgi:flagella synthesis protein FlgN
MSFSNPLNNDRLAKSISQDIQACEHLRELLSKERELLKNREIDALDPLIEAKTKILNQLNQSAITRSQWTAHYQRESQQAEQDIAKVFIQYAKENGLAEQWRKLQSLFKECQMANEINGKTLMRSQSTHERLLSILRGQSVANNLYTDKGAKRNSASGSALGKA